MGQIFDLLRMFGLADLVKKKRRHEKALPFIRGYSATASLWALFNTGVMDELRRGPASAEDLAAKLHLDARVLGHVLEYLDCIRVLRKDADGKYSLDRLGRDLVEEPRGAFDLACGYESVLAELTAMVKGEKRFGRDVRRREAFVARGSGELGVQLPFPVMADIIRRNRFKSVLDLGSGDLELLFTLCEAVPGLKGIGIDISPDAIAVARERLAASKFRDRVTVEQGDIFDLDALLARHPDVDVMTACDVFHEHLLVGKSKLETRNSKTAGSPPPNAEADNEPPSNFEFRISSFRVETFLSETKGRAPNAAVLVAEFCRQPHERLRRRPTAFVEHHLWHNLTDQVILSADEWREVFRKSGRRVVEEHVFDIVGHGYFLLR